jgi:hypothetical protein
MSPFQFDDFANLSQLSRVASDGSASFVFGNISGPSGRPVAMASFLLNDQAWPAYAPDFKFTNVQLHLVNGLLAFWFLFTLFSFLSFSERRAAVVAAITTLIWITMSAHISTVLYAVQRMTLLSISFSLTYLIVCLKISSSIRDGATSVIKLIALVFLASCFALLAVLSKETALMWLILPLFIEIMLVRARKVYWYRIRITLMGVLALLLASLVAYHIYSYSVIASSYEYRDYSMAGKLVLFPVFLISYLLESFGLIHRVPTLFYDGLYSELLSRYFIILIAWALFFTFFVWLHRNFVRRPLVAFFSVCFVFLHALEGGIISVEPYFSHRNYGPSLFAAMLFVLLCVALAERLNISAILCSVPALILMNFILLYAGNKYWGHNGMLAYTWAAEHTYSLRAQRYYSHVLELKGELGNARKVELDSISRFPNALAGYLNVVNYNCSLGYDNEEILQKFDVVSRKERFYRKNVYALLAAAESAVEKDVLRCLSPSEREMLVGALSRIALDKMFFRERLAASRIWFTVAKLHFYDRNLTKALQSIDKALEAQASFALGVEKALWLMAGAMYSEVLVTIEDVRNQESFGDASPDAKRFLGEIERDAKNLLVSP